MGNLLSRKKKQPPGQLLLSPPAILTSISADQVRDVIVRALGIPEQERDKIKLADRDYGLYSKADLQRFLGHDQVDHQQYMENTFDCDDFADVLKGHEREWFRFHKHPGLGSTFGVLWGDIRHKDQPDKPRPHAVNYCITSEGKLRLIEPQTDRLFKLVQGSKVWLVVG